MRRECRVSVYVSRCWFPGSPPTSNETFRGFIAHLGFTRPGRSTCPCHEVNLSVTCRGEDSHLDPSSFMSLVMIGGSDAGKCILAVARMHTFSLSPSGPAFDSEDRVVADHAEGVAVRTNADSRHVWRGVERSAAVRG